MAFEFLPVVTVTITYFWDVTSYYVGRYKRFEEAVLLMCSKYRRVRYIIKLEASPNSRTFGYKFWIFPQLHGIFKLGQVRLALCVLGGTRDYNQNMIDLT